jgi:hypothetical protein
MALNPPVFSNTAGPYNLRSLLDINYVATIALPNGAANTCTAAFDLIQATPYPVTEVFNVKLSTTASASGNSINLAIALQHSATNVDANFVNIPELGPLVTISNSTITNANSDTYKLPPTCLRFIRARCFGVANMGNLSDSTLTMSCLF